MFASIVGVVPANAGGHTIACLTDGEKMQHGGKQKVDKFVGLPRKRLAPVWRDATAWEQDYLNLRFC